MIHKANGRAASARNAGIKVAQGDAQTVAQLGRCIIVVLGHQQQQIQLQSQFVVSHGLLLEIKTQFGAQQMVALAMIGTDAVEPDTLAMPAGGIALVGTPIVHGIFLIQTVHIVVAEGLGKDAGSGNGQELAITLDNGLIGQ